MPVDDDCDVEVDGVVVDGVCCCVVWSWEVPAVPEVDDWSCATAMLAASKNVAVVKNTAFFMVPPNRSCPMGVRGQPPSGRVQGVDSGQLESSY